MHSHGNGQFIFYLDLYVQNNNYFLYNTYWTIGSYARDCVLDFWLLETSVFEVKSLELVLVFGTQILSREKLEMLLSFK